MAESPDVQALRKMAQEFEAGFNTGDVERIMRYYGDRYVDVNLRHPTHDHQQRREYYSSVIRKGIRVRVVPHEIEVHGEWGFVWGHLEVTRSPGEPTVELRYLEISRKQPDGTWQVVWGMDGPVQEYVPAARD